MHMLILYESSLFLESDTESVMREKFQTENKVLHHMSYKWKHFTVKYGFYPETNSVDEFTSQVYSCCFHLLVLNQLNDSSVTLPSKLFYVKSVLF